MRSEVAKARRSQLTLLRLAEPDIVAGTNISSMVGSAARARIALARGVLVVADGLVRSASRRSSAAAARSAISRYYYAMFQAVRAVVFVAVDGDDHNDHQELPKRLPSSFPQRATWVNELKKARNARNDADYDPYPAASGYWLSEAKSLKPLAHSFVAEADTFLTTMGVMP